MHRHLLVIGNLSCIGVIDLFILECIEGGIRFVFRLKCLVIHIIGQIEFNQPVIGMHCLIQYGFERQWFAAGTGQIGKHIIGAGIGIQGSHIAVSTGNKPGCSKFLFGQHGRS